MAPSASSSYRFKLNKTKLLVVVYVSIAVNVAIHLRQFYQPITEDTLKNSNNYYHHGLGMIPIPKEETIFLSNNNDKDLPPPICTSRTIKFPVFPSVKVKQDTTDKEKMKKPLTVGLVTSNEPFKVTTKHVLVDGLEGSKHFDWTVTCLLKDNVGCRFDRSVDLWILDLVRLRTMDWNFINHALTQQLLHPAHTSTAPKFKVLLIDYTDQINFEDLKFFVKLGLINNATSPSTARNNHAHLRLALSTIVQGRHYDHRTKQIRPGSLIDIDRWQIGGGPILQTSYTIRSDVVDAMQRVLSIGPAKGSTTNTQISHDCDRPMDIIHLWQPETGSKQTRNAARFRDDVSLLVQAMNGTTQPTGHSASSSSIPLTTSIEIHGTLGIKGRSNVDLEYLEALLSSKIVVVTQRDKWEDHYRLMEALCCSGALVVSDDMLSLPVGLRNGTNIVLFRSTQELESLLRYYLSHEQERLEIAKRGYRVAMGQHRAWHRLEELVFGCPLTSVGMPEHERGPATTC